MVIFLKGIWGTLDYFIDCMAKGMEAVYVLNVKEDGFLKQLSDLDVCINETTDVVTFNNVGVGVIAGGQNYWEMKKVKLHNIYVDAPIWYLDTLNLNLQCMQIITVDRYHQEFINRYFPAYRSVKFLPHGGTLLADAKEIAYKERQIDVLYVGRRRKSRRSGQDGGLLIQEEVRETFHIIKHLLMKYPFLTVEKVFDLYMKEVGTEWMANEELAMIGGLYEEVVYDVSGYYQEKVVESLACAGIHVEIYPDHGWEEIADKYPDYIHIHKGVSSEECLRLMHNSKITLNVLPWFKYGAHERIYNAMLNGSVCVTDTSEYLKRYFENDKNIVLFELDKLEDLAKKVRYILDNPDYAQYIIENQKKAAANSTWGDRLNNILGQRFEEGKDFI